MPNARKNRVRDFAVILTNGRAHEVRNGTARICARNDASEKILASYKKYTDVFFVRTARNFSMRVKIASAIFAVILTNGRAHEVRNGTARICARNDASEKILASYKKYTDVFFVRTARNFSMRVKIASAIFAIYTLEIAPHCSQFLALAKKND